MENQNSRIEYFDWIRGLMILWMLIYHISLNYGRITFGEAEEGATIFTFMSFFMATFYVSSGYFFSIKNDIKNFFIKKLKKIFIPYCVFTIFGLVVYEAYYLITQGHLGEIDLMAAIPTGCLRTNTPLWFFFSLFMCNIIYMVINKLFSREYIVHFIIALCFVLAFVTKNKPQIFGYGNILLGITFIHLGYCLCKHTEQVAKRHWVIIAIAFYILLGIIFPSRLEFVRNILVQGSYILNFVFTIVACFALWYISQLWNHDNIIGHSLIYIGKTSLVIFAAHRPILNWIIEPVIRNIYPNVPYSVFTFISLVIILSMCYGLDILIKKHCPTLIGG
ncbi:MAG: acyltransferase [Lachnospiraceae bacterium]|nr:acyltransferase [Lachnospiraceae bacterium]